MSKNKLKKFAEMETFPHVFQFPYRKLQNQEFELKGKWGNVFFKNDNPIVLELGCGRGEYALALAQKYPQKNFIAIDIKGARMWTGAKESLNLNLKNIAFLRTNIEMINLFFAQNEVDELWITFPDPQMKKFTKRLTATPFIERYRTFLKPQGLIHLKTDSPFLFSYTTEMIEHNQLVVNTRCNNLYDNAEMKDDPILTIKTCYEQQWLARGKTIKYIQFYPPESKTILKEPEVDIPFDDYRSFGRRRTVQEQ